MVLVLWHVCQIFVPISAFHGLLLTGQEFNSWNISTLIIFPSSPVGLSCWSSTLIFQKFGKSVKYRRARMAFVKTRGCEQARSAKNQTANNFKDSIVRTVMCRYVGHGGFFWAVNIAGSGFKNLAYTWLYNSRHILTNSPVSMMSSCRDDLLK